MPPLLEFLQQNAAIFGTLTGVAAVLGLAFSIYKASHDSRVAALERQLKEAGSGDAKALKKLNEELTEQRDAVKSEVEALRAETATLQLELSASDAKLLEQQEHEHAITEGLTEFLEAAKTELDRRDREERSKAKLLQRAMRLEGKVWERKVLQGAPRFRPLHERHVPIISVLNLKGGVGKTTVTAHLGTAFATKGYRPLLADLDLQGSLSSLFIHETILSERGREGLLLQHILSSVADRQKVNLLDHCVPVLDGKLALIPTTDNMAYAELNLTMRWLLRIGKRDTRFLLRKLLHQKRIARRYDVVLLDCPPLFNTSCVNALAASDYVIIPVTPSKKAAERIPLLLERLKSLHRVINPELQVAGIVLNRTRSTQLTAREQDLWQDILERGKDQWKSPVHGFNTCVRETTEVRESESEFLPPDPGSELHTLFCSLVAELEARIPRDCRRVAASSFGPE